MSVTLSPTTSRNTGGPSITSTYMGNTPGTNDHHPSRRSLLGCLRLPPIASPSVQLVGVAIICLLCPGMFNALNGLGGAGLVAPGPANDSNVALYACFAVVGFFGGFIVNAFGLKPTLFVGGVSYAVYASSFLGYKYIQNRGFLIFGGAFLGLCAGPFWAAQGAMLLSYPAEEQKGRSTSWFWAIFNCGAAIGSLELRTNGGDTASDSTYITIIGLMLLGAILSLFLSHPTQVRRSDGTHIQIEVTISKSWLDEFKIFCKTLRKDYYIALLFPMFLTSNWCYPYQFNTFNLTTFNIRTRALNNFLYWLAEILGALVVGHTLDDERFRRSHRAKGLVAGLILLTFGIWTGGYIWQRQHHGDGVLQEAQKIDLHNAGYLEPMARLSRADRNLRILGKFTSDTGTGAIYVGFYKGVQSAGGAISYRINNSDLSAMNEFLICWIILAVSLAMAAPVIIHKIRDDEDQHDAVVESGPTEKMEEAVEAREMPREAVVVGDAMAKELET
ncbi:DUF895 domain membrane protein [Rutstroemia sp. NJR-2017a WRK4]|nr:DUF895 domain membrane protein [Rutstroemia sp. NJR-2017a WRK4]